VQTYTYAESSKIAERGSVVFSPGFEQAHSQSLSLDFVLVGASRITVGVGHSHLSLLWTEATTINTLSIFAYHPLSSVTTTTTTTTGLEVLFTTILIAPEKASEQVLHK